MARFLCTVVDDYLQTCAAGTSSMAQLQAHLGEVALGAVSAADYVNHEFGGLAPFLELFEAEFAVGVPPGSEVLPSEASVVVQSKAVAARSEDERIESNLGTAAAAAAATAWAVDDEFDDDIVDDEEAAAIEASARAAVDTREEGTAWQERGRSDGALLVDGCRRVRSRFGARGGVSLGAVSTGALGDEPTYRDARELADDVALCVAEGVGDITLFDYAGVLRRAPADAWLDALVTPPEAPRTPRSSLRVHALLGFAAAVGHAPFRARGG
jgi:hypothetical protein